MLVENPTRQPNLGVVETNEVTGALDDRGPLPAGGFSPFSCDVWLRGSDTPGTAPEFSPLMQGCAFTETLTAAPITGTASAGAAGSITVVPASYAGIQIGMVITTTAGTGSGQARVVSGKPGTNVVEVYPNWTVNPNATTTYVVPANALYKPTSTSLKTVSIYRYKHRSDGGNSKLDKVLGAAGSVSFSMPVRQPCRMSFAFQGQLNPSTDVTHPGSGTFQNTRGQPYLGADTYLGGSPIKLNTLTLDYGANVQMIDNPAQSFGYDSAGITRRRVAGRLNPPQDLISVRDAFTGWLNGSTSKFWVRWGTVTGNRVVDLHPAAALHRGRGGGHQRFRPRGPAVPRCRFRHRHLHLPLLGRAFC